MKFTSLFFVVPLLVASVIVAAPDQYFDRAVGTYTRPSRVCGGQGSADAKSSYTGVFEDSLASRKPLSLQSKSNAMFEISFSVHYADMDYCGLEGSGNWSAGKLVLTPTNKSTARSSCRLSLKVSGNSVQVLDPGNSCARDLCTTPSGRLNGVMYRKQK